MEPLSFGGAWELAFTCKASEPDFDLIAPKLVVLGFEFLEPESENGEGVGKNDKVAEVATWWTTVAKIFKIIKRTKRKQEGQEDDNQNQIKNWYLLNFALIPGN